MPLNPSHHTSYFFTKNLGGLSYLIPPILPNGAKQTTKTHRMLWRPKPCHFVLLVKKRCREQQRIRWRGLLVGLRWWLEGGKVWSSQSSESRPRSPTQRQRGFSMFLPCRETWAFSAWISQHLENHSDPPMVHVTHFINSCIQVFLRKERRLQSPLWVRSRLHAYGHCVPEDKNKEEYPSFCVFYM